MATVDIDLYYDLDRRRWTTSAGGLAAQPSLFIGQSNDIDFRVRFVQGGVPIELTSPSWIAGIKVTDDPLGDYLLLTTTGTQTGTGATTIYTFSLNIDSVELQAYLVGITPTTNSTAFEVRDTVNNIATLPAITCSILPDYTLTGATPAAGSGTLVVDSGATFTVHKTFAMPTTDGFNNYVLKTNGAGVGSWAVDSAGTGTVTSVAQSFTGGIVSVGGSPVTTSGTLALTVAGTSGGIPYFSSGTTWATSGVLGAGALVVGGGAGATPTALAAVASGQVLTSAGTTTTPAYSSTITLGASGTLGTITLGNATSGTILITPPTGALGTLTITLPSTSTTLAGLAVTQTFSANQTFSGTINIAATTSTAGQITQAGTRILHTYGTENLFLGNAAGNTTNTGQYSTGIGTRAMFSLTTGRQNLCFGWQAGYFVTTGWDNMIFGGYNTGHGINTGSGNTIIGASADATNGNYRGAIGAGASCTADDTIVIGKAAGTYSVAGTPGSRSADAVIIRGALTVSGGATIASGQALKLGNAATTGLTAGALAATTNASITITDSAGVVYRIPCII